MNRNQIPMAIIGGGAIAELFHLPALCQNKTTQNNIWIAEPNATRREYLQEKFPIAGCVENYAELIGNVDAFIVATPPATHFDICRTLLSQGKHVLCEKPLTESHDQAVKLAELANANNVQLLVNQTRRFFPTYQKIRDLILGGSLGELRSIKYHEGVEFDWPAAGRHHFEPQARGAWSDTGVHLLDTVCFWLNAHPELVSMHDDGFAGPEALVTTRLKHQQCDIELKISRLGKLPNCFEIVGTKGKIKSDVENFTTVAVESESGIVTHKCSRPLKYLDLSHLVLANFVDSMQGYSNPLAAASTNVAVIELLEEGYRRAERFSMPWNERIVPEVFCTAGDTSPPNKILVTGASGFLGGRLIECLSQHEGTEAIAGLRSWTRAARPARFGSTIRLCDLEDNDQVAAALKDVTAVIHCAKTDSRESIVGGTKALLEESQRLGINKFVYLSTAEVYGPDADGHVTEKEQLEPTGRLYGDSKLEAEQVCLGFADQGMDIKILRPSIIYGPFSVSWSVDMAKRIHSGRWGTFSDHGEGFANLVYVDDLVQAIWLCLNRETKQRVFNINGPETPTWNEYFAAFNNAMELPPLSSIDAGKSSIKTRVVDTVEYFTDKLLERFEDQIMEIYMRGGFLSRVMKRVKGELDSTPSGNELHDLFSRKANFSDALARQHLGYEPRVSLPEGLARTTDWLRLHELIPASSERQVS